MLYLLESLTDHAGLCGNMAGLVPGQAIMQKQLTALALQSVVLPEGELRGHTYHHSRLECSAQPITHGQCPNGGKTAEAVFRDGRLTASYVHFYFASNPEAAAQLFLP
jgi:cobyrinic acid a,c-diamide synthase